MFSPENHVCSKEAVTGLSPQASETIKKQLGNRLLFFKFVPENSLAR